MIYVCGDTHGTLDLFKIYNWKEKRGLTKDDFLIIAGDAGILWNPAKDKEVIDFWSNQPFTTLFIDGNHENFDLIKELPSVDIGFGEEVGKVNDSIFYLKRGCVYNIDNKNIFTFGGGNSIDKARRQERVSWWPEELPNQQEYIRGLESLYNVGGKVDYVITHTCTTEVVGKLFNYLDFKAVGEDDEKQLREYFSMLVKEDRFFTFKKWYYGHFHIDKDLYYNGSKFFCLYNRAPIRID